MSWFAYTEKKKSIFETTTGYSLQGGKPSLPKPVNSTLVKRIQDSPEPKIRPPKPAQTMRLTEKKKSKFETRPGYSLQVQSEEPSPPKLVNSTLVKRIQESPEPKIRPPKPAQTMCLLYDDDELKLSQCSLCTYEQPWVHQAQCRLCHQGSLVLL